MSIDWLSTGAGFVVGTIVGLTGVGGGALMTPLLVLFFGVSPQTAVGTDLLYATVTKSVGSSIHGAFGAVNWYVLRRLWAGSLPAAALTLIILQHAPGGRELGKYIIPLLGVVLLSTGLIMLGARQFAEQLRTSHLSARVKPFQTPLTVLAGALLGFTVTLTSVGAGAIGVVMLVVLYPKRLSGQRLVGTDIAHAIPLTLLAGLGHAKLGHVNFPMLWSLLIGSIPGIAVGSLLSHRMNASFVRSAVAVMLVIVGGKLLLG